jgi:endonuclease YncB( thermonuclease family)
VTLTTDPSQQTKDRYGRLLAYAYAARGEVEVAQLNRGWAKVSVYRHKRFADCKRYRAAARASPRSTTAGSGAPAAGSFHTPAD